MHRKLRYFTQVVKRKKPSRTGRTSTARKQRTSNKRKQLRGARKLSEKKPSIFRKMGLKLGSLAFTFALIGLLILVWFANELPDIEKLESYDKAPGIRIYDTSKNLIGSYGHVVGNYITYDELPKHLIQALLATEDRRFFEHSGVDPWGIARAMARNIAAGGVVQGGSTITQQLAKNTFLTPARTLKRKVQEVMLSLWIENHFSKEKIVEIYLNRVYLGAGNYGIDAASYHYFEKSATDLSLQESALLVGLLKAPSRYAPTRDKELSFKRTKQVVLNMKDAEMLNDRAASKAIAGFDEAINLKVESGNGSRYFANWVVDLIPSHVGQVDGDLEVHTTLNPKLQLQAEEIMKRYLDGEGKKKDVSQMALLTTASDGAVKAMVGGKDYNKSQFNRVTQARRQPGSAFKLFVYLAALEWGMTPNSWVVDKKIRIGKWSPKNYNNRFMGEMKLREAFFRSVNTVAVQLMNRVGISTVTDVAKRLGVEEELGMDLTISLGTKEITMLEMVGAYAHIANNGKKTKPYAISKIINQKTGDTIFERTGKESEGVVVRANIARMMNDMLTDTIAFGTGKKANFGRPAAGKTGTSQNSRDAWFIGYTPQYVTGVWVGNDDNSPTLKVTGGDMPARIWRDMMKVAHKNLPVMKIQQEYKYFDGDPMEGDIYSATGAGLPWIEDGTVSAKNPTGRPNQELPWQRNKRNSSNNLPWMRDGTVKNPRHELHNGAPVNRDVKLPTSKKRSAPQEESREEPQEEWVRERMTPPKKKKYEYPQGGRKRRLFQ